jgi:hypothetical protein
VELSEEWNESIIVPVYKKGEKTDFCNHRGISLLSTTYKILSIILLSRVTPNADEIAGVFNVDFDPTDQLLIIYTYFASVKYLRKNENTMKQYISYF